MEASMSTCARWMSRRLRVAAMRWYSAALAWMSRVLLMRSAMTRTLPARVVVTTLGPRAPPAAGRCRPRRRNRRRRNHRRRSRRRCQSRRRQNRRCRSPAGAEAAGAAGAEAAGAAGAELVAVGAELAGEAVVDVAVAAGAGEAGGDAGEAAEAGAGLGGGAVDAVEQLGQVVGGAVLHLVDEQLGFGAVDVGLVEALDPVAHFVEVGGARGDDQHGVDALDGDDAQGTEQGAGFAHALQGGGGAGGALRGRGGRGRAGARGGAGGGARGGSGGGAAGEHAQGVVDLGGAGVFEREHADGHAAQEVDVEGLDEVEPAFGLGAGAAHDEHVAQVVDADDGVGGDHGLQDFGHLAGAQVFERDDDGAVAGRQGFAGLGQHGGGNDALEGFGGADVVGAAGSRAMTMPLTWSADSSSSRARSALTLPRVVRVMVPLSGG
jgi:hypothetical protein